ncbi:T9SS type A sorting domain-containing protein [Flavobacterium sharifuzzamanii]|uniref:T9SS type A sorting domain-containing protein n=1 Tax=Flavobacterium sharifuzzamanii TaxID=2211133 RepID=UPI000DAC4FAE|nr:T9SS type A sorting domain-containing protein [Flavobacterium sharifuzzamanii]KAF2082197.1 T9SS type A sorting domain-containing protein [Flavobacterium sharifuzzamanii]
MKINQRTFLILVLASFSFVTHSYAQESIVVTGGKGTGSGGAASYSVGQIADIQLKGSGGSAQQGIQQAYEIATLSNDKFDEISLVMTAFPNPVVDELNLIVINNKFENLSYNLFDINGRILSKVLHITSSETKVSMQGLTQGVYFLAVHNNSKTIKTFKIIKK